MDKGISEKVAKLRKDYRLSSLGSSDVASDPFSQFDSWFKEAQRAELLEPNAMTLATSSIAGRPSARTVLLKGFDQKGFVFYTNYTSHKGEELTANPYAALLFLWLELERQVRIVGKVELISEEEATTYFQSRPKGSQIGAWASSQSKKIDSREVLERNAEAITKKYADSDKLPKPPQWGGYRVLPEKVEFWQGRTNRLHDRILYEWIANSWRISRLAP